MGASPSTYHYEPTANWRGECLHYDSNLLDMLPAVDLRPYAMSCLDQGTKPLSAAIAVVSAYMLTMHLRGRGVVLPAIEEVHQRATASAALPSLVRAAAALSQGTRAQLAEEGTGDCVEGVLTLRKLLPEVEQICACLEQSACVVCALRFAETALDEGVWNAGDVGSDDGVVCVVIVGYSVFDRVLWCQMPWGARFGDRGFVRLPFDYIGADTVAEAFACGMRDRYDEQRPMFLPA